MELHQLRYFVAVAETGGFSKAARICYVAQPSLSQQIIKLEHELGQRLFERLGRTSVLTEAGRALLPRARLILKEAGDIKS
ncbi:MAG: LysR family transcriptional regulator, partial [Thermodesulfobacteriota bacterium]